MAKKNTIVTEVASALGAAAARVENLKPKRTTTKHAKAKIAAPVAQEPEKVSETTSEPVYNRDEVALIAYLYWEARGFQGGSPEEDWLRAEQEYKSRLQA